MNTVDWGLRLRMGGVMLALVVLYLFFLAVLSQFTSWLVVAIIAGVFLFGQYYYSAELALKGMSAERVTNQQYPELHQTISRLSQNADIPKPDVAVSSVGIANAFAAGRSPSNSVVCVTEPLLQKLDEDELEAVLAHEVAHIKNRDVLVLTLASFLSTVAFMIFRYGIYFQSGVDNAKGKFGIFGAVLTSLIVWILSFFLLRGLSRYREFGADRGGAELTGNPSALASALRTLSEQQTPNEDMRKYANKNAFFIVHVDTDSFLEFFSTHPSMDRRIEKLQELERESLS